MAGSRLVEDEAPPSMIGPELRGELEINRHREHRDASCAGEHDFPVVDLPCKIRFMAPGRRLQKAPVAGLFGLLEIRPNRAARMAKKKFSEIRVPKETFHFALRREGLTARRAGDSSDEILS